MPKTDFTQYDKDPANNTDVDGVDIAEGCAPSGINNAIRSVMSHIAEMNDGTVAMTSPDINGGTINGITDLSVSGDLTVDTNTLYVDSTNNSVGIGTTSPSITGLSGTLTVASGSQGVIEIKGTTDTDDSAISNILAYNSNDVVASQITTRNDGTNGGSLSFSTANAGTSSERLRITSNGSVGIGTTSPATFAKLHVNDSSNTFAYTKFTNSTTGTTNTDGLTVGISSANALIYNYESGNIQFATAGTERMRIDSSGDLLIGCTTSPSSSVLGAAFMGDGGGSKELRISSPVTSTDNVCLFYNPNGNVGRIQTYGSATNYSTSSDYRLKQDWQAMTGATERVKSLNPVNFAWKIDGSRVDGFLAHEAQEIVPEAVTGEKDAMREEEYEVTPAVLDEDGNVVTEAVMGTRQVPEYQGIDQSKLVPLLTAALQEAIAKIETLEEKVSALENA